jgi:hypothetical protein
MSKEKEKAKLEESSSDASELQTTLSLLIALDMTDSML